MKVLPHLTLKKSSEVQNHTIFTIPIYHSFYICILLVHTVAVTKHSYKYLCKAL